MSVKTEGERERSQTSKNVSFNLNDTFYDSLRVHSSLKKKIKTHTHSLYNLCPMLTHTAETFSSVDMIIADKHLFNHFGTI